MTTERSSTLWLVGRLKSGAAPNAVWDFQGIFSSEDKAVGACRDASYFIIPVELDQQIPHETVPCPPGSRYPLKRG